MNTGPGGGPRHKPLPLRREFWRIMPKLIKDGQVVLPENEQEINDARAAAFSVLIDYQEERLIKEFNRPELADKDLYTEFATVYSVEITEHESEIWDELAAEVQKIREGKPAALSEEVVAAFLTLKAANAKRKVESVHPHSIELYQFLPKFTESYETLLKEKYGDTYSPHILYAALQKHMPKFMATFIAQDPVIANLISVNLMDEESLKKPETSSTTTGRFEPRMMELSADDALKFKQKLIDAIHEHAKENAITKDSMGRTEDRGCPILYSSKRNAVLQFAVDEMIAQHQAYIEREEHEK